VTDVAVADGTDLPAKPVLPIRAVQHLDVTNFTSLQDIIKFPDNDQNYFLIAANKAASNAKNLREAAAYITSNEQRQRDVAQWLIDLAVKFERCEGE
jgi:hypothetical protein